MDKVVRLLGLVAISALLCGAAADGPRGDEGRGGSIDSIVQTVGSSSGNGVEISGQRRTRISGPSNSNHGAGSRTSFPASVTALRNVPLTSAQLQDAFNAICVGDGDCGVRQGTELNPLILDQEPADPAARVDATTAGEPARVVTVEDVARFLPTSVTLHAEPDGWAVVGVPANFWTYVKPVTVEGSLLGEQASVRFTPQVYRWDYGDGASRSTRSGGASWSGLGQQELSMTSTSHIYRSKATLSASVTVVWSAEYRFAGSEWTAIAGAVSNSSPATRVLVVKERTVLTAG